MVGHEPPVGRSAIEIDYARITPGFLEAVGIDLLEGRNFQTTDDADNARVVIVTQAFVDRFWPGESGLGRVFDDDGTPVRIVGVSSDVKVRTLGEEPRPLIYYPLTQSYAGFLTFVVATTGDADVLSQEIMRAGRQLDPQLLVWERTTVDKHIGTMLIGARIGAGLLGAFALIALVLASVGLYGVVSYAVSQRTREVGIRMSLGAEKGQVVRMLMSSGVRLVVVGGAIGLLLSAGAAQLMTQFLFGVQAFDPITFTVVPTVFVAIAALAAYMPARRASSVDPVIALRSEG